jgi:hypothetical protein
MDVICCQTNCEVGILKRGEQLSGATLAALLEVSCGKPGGGAPGDDAASPCPLYPSVAQVQYRLTLAAQPTCRPAQLELGRIRARLQLNTKRSQ